MLIKLRKGQSTLEYALVIAAVVAALVMMQIYLKRGLGGRFKASTDDIGQQFDPQKFTSTYTTTSEGKTRETVQDKITMSEVQDDEATNVTGSETLESWDDNEDLYTGNW